MERIITDFFIAIALSMDAFSISICMATSNLLNKIKLIVFPFIVGIFHFIMPLLGNKLGLLVSINLEEISNYILSFIFLVLGIEIISSKEKEDYKIMNYFYLFLIAFTVSIDSFTVGLGLSLTSDYTLLSSLIFSLSSLTFTIFGLSIGKYLNSHIGRKANIVGCILLFLLSIKYFFKL